MLMSTLTTVQSGGSLHGYGPVRLLGLPSRPLIACCSRGDVASSASSSSSASFPTSTRHHASSQLHGQRPDSRLGAEFLFARAALVVGTVVAQVVARCKRTHPCRAVAFDSPNHPRPAPKVAIPTGAVSRPKADVVAANAVLDKRVKAWNAAGNRVAVALTETALEDVLKRELKLRFGQVPGSLGGRPCFRFSSREAPGIYCANRVVTLFWLSSLGDVLALRRGKLHTLEQKVEEAARSSLEAAMPASLVPRHSDGIVRYFVEVRPASRGVERHIFGEEATIRELRDSVKQGLRNATSWCSNRQEPDVEIFAFIGHDHIALGITLPSRTATEPGFGERFTWGSVPYIGMTHFLAGAMAWLASEPLRLGQQGINLTSGLVENDAGVVVDPACGAGTLLLAAAQQWPNAVPRLIGRDTSKKILRECENSFEHLGLDASGIDCGDGRHIQDLQDGAAVAVLCDLPCGSKHEVVSPKVYDGFLDEAARLLRPGGRCVLLTTRREMLARAVNEKFWRVVAALSVKRGSYGNSALLVLERRGLTYV
mmetsp:Transcript_32114/g.81087  ORF Transcript_32114/g.81087 Transcript_32114/m.81087 type:complete len:540 (+) Transcript_32114:3-1622(+)